MPQQNLPDLRIVSQRLADHNRRVARYVDGLADRVDQLVAATRSRDWSKVRRLSEFLACSSDLFGCAEIAQAAHHVCHEIDQPDNELAVKRGVMRLISLCGKLPENVAGIATSRNVAGTATSSVLARPAEVRPTRRLRTRPRQLSRDR